MDDGENICTKFLRVAATHPPAAAAGVPRAADTPGKHGTTAAAAGFLTGDSV